MPFTPPAVPTVPLTERVVGYTLTAAATAVVPFTIWGDISDLFITLNGVEYTTATLVSPSGLAAPTPITDGVLHFSPVVTGHLVIEGRRAPRRTSNTVEGGDTARVRNIDTNTIVSTQVELKRRVGRAMSLTPSELADTGSFAARGLGISNVATGVLDGDAANVGQLAAAIAAGIATTGPDRIAAQAAAAAAAASQGAATAASNAALAAELLAQQYASDAATVSGVNVPIYASKASATGATIVAGVKSIATQFFAPTYTTANTLVGGGYYSRMSLATITAAAYPALSYFRSTDRFMPDGTTDATNGGYWALNDDVPTPQMLGLKDDNASADQTAIMQAWLDLCGILGKPCVAPVPAHIKITDTITFPTEATIDIRNLFITYAGTRDRAALYVNSANFKSMLFGRVSSLVADWSNEDYVGIYFHDVNACYIRLQITNQFTVGYGLFATNGAPYNRIWPGRVQDNKYAERLQALASGGFINENVFYSGDYRNSSVANALGAGYGVHVKGVVGNYNGHNNNRWEAPSFELGNATSGVSQRTPFFFDAAGSLNTCVNARAENNVGPLALCNGSIVRSNDLGFSFGETGALQINAIQEYNGANGNKISGRLGGETRKQFDNLHRLLSSDGGANVPYVRGDVFLMESTSGAARRSTTTAARLLSNALGLELQAGVMAVMVAVDTSKIKLWRLNAAYVGALGNILTIAFDASGTRLTGDATDVLGNEKYIKNATVGWAANAGWGGGYTGGSWTSDLISVRDEVQTMWIGLYGAVVRSMELIGYWTHETLANVVGAQGISTWVPLDDDGSVKLASAKPDTAGTHGYYSKGQVVYNTGTASGQPSGWQCTTAGWLAAAWVLSTAYSALGRIVTNDTGKMYQLVTAGTSAGSGGPTGTGAAITDGTCVWNYVGVKAVFAALANVP